jgi:hypothetical protein
MELKSVVEPEIRQPRESCDSTRLSMRLGITGVKRVGRFEKEGDGLRVSIELPPNGPLPIAGAPNRGDPQPVQDRPSRPSAGRDHSNAAPSDQ